MIKTPRPMSSPKALLALTLLVATATTACSASGNDPRADQSTGSTIVWGKPLEAELLDTTNASGSSWELYALAYERLVAIDNDLKVVPELAESWQQTSPTTYEFTLRSGIKFSNGRELTADDVTGSLKRLVDPKNGAIWAGQLGIRTVETMGAGKVTVSLKAPRTSFLPALAGGPAVILPMKELQDGSFDPKKQLLGTGPFMVADHKHGESWTFVRNPHYWRSGVPKAERLQVRIMPDDAARSAALRDGSIDVTTFQSPDAMQLLKADRNVKTVVQPTTDYYLLYVNQKSSLFRDDRLRQALALAIDREKIRTVALAGVGRATAAVPVAFEGVCDPGAMPFATPDLKRARQLVTEAGALGTTIEISTQSAVPMGSPIAQVMQKNLEQAGFTVKILALDTGELMKRAFSGKTADFDLIVNWVAGYADPAMILTWWNPELTVFNRPWANSDPTMNALIDRGVQTPPGDARTQTLRDACTRAAQNANIVPLVSKDAIIAYRGDQVTADIPPVEGYAVPLRQLANFQKNG